MKRSALQISLIALAVLIVAAATVQSRPLVPDNVRKELSGKASSSVVEFLISFEDDLDISALKINRLRQARSRTAEYRDVMSRLQANRQSLESSLIPVLDELQASGKVESYKFFTVSKTVLIRAKAGILDILADLPGARLINLNAEVTLIEPADETEAPTFEKAALANSALETINVRSLWNRGLTGKGRLICSFDTGVDGDHPALASKWRGNYGVPAGAAWFAPQGDTIPDDKLGHGSHTMGVLVGSTESDTLGVAPGAQWISAAVIDQGTSFSTTIADILSAFDWALNPDGNINTIDDVPDVICNSWGVPRGIFSDCDNTFWTAIDNVEAAGIVTVFAAGNEGPDAQTIRNPADRATSPINALSVGAIDQSTMQVATFSSRGPAACTGAIKPEVVAPGVSIYSSYKDGGYKLMSGTSMAAPFIAGLAALMRQYNPEATVQEIKEALIAAAIDLGPTGEDNAYGHGLVDASALLNYLTPPELPQLTVHNHQIVSGGDGFADPGETAEVTLVLNDPTMTTNEVEVWVSSGSEQIVIEPDTLQFQFALGAAYAVGTDPFIFSISPDAISGRPVNLTVHYRFTNLPGQDSVVYALLLGHEMPGESFMIEAGRITFTGSDFAQFGLGTGSIYQAGGEGFRFSGGDNLLYECGLIVGRDFSMVSDGIRNAVGGFKESDFYPGYYAKDLVNPDDDSVKVEFGDDGAILPIPVDVSQTLYYSRADYIIFDFTISNPTASRISNLSFGLFFDFDLDRFGDEMGFDSLMGVMYQYNPEVGVYIGWLGLNTGEFAYRAGTNGISGKRGFTVSDKYGLITGAGVDINGAGAADWYTSVSRTAAQVEALRSTRLTVALVAGETIEIMRMAAQAAMNEYNINLDADDRQAVLPTAVELAQNYPNPFNPETVIEFSIPSAENVSLYVYNILGQKVRTLYDGYCQAGLQQVVWDGRDESGQSVASGVYLYRIVAGESTASRKMVLMK